MCVAQTVVRCIYRMYDSTPHNQLNVHHCENASADVIYCIAVVYTLLMSLKSYSLTALALEATIETCTCLPLIVQIKLSLPLS
jgi:hypothetical protein